MSPQLLPHAATGPLPTQQAKSHNCVQNAESQVNVSWCNPTAYAPVHDINTKRSLQRQKFNKKCNHADQTAPGEYETTQIFRMYSLILQEKMGEISWPSPASLRYKGLENRRRDLLSTTDDSEFGAEKKPILILLGAKMLEIQFKSSALLYLVRERVVYIRTGDYGAELPGP
ncbi:hypothetical protein B0H12DRAFT_1075837 [Mycena haematopus]|nr:hypothetical protein B0H12DRAFT_1075837 [Mycena haematopus]